MVYQLGKAKSLLISLVKERAIWKTLEKYLSIFLSAIEKSYQRAFLMH